MRLAGIPWVTEKTNLSWDERRWWLRMFVARRIVCLSQAQVRLMRRWQKKIVVIPTGVDLARFQNAQPLRRQDFALQSSDIVLACVAHLVPVKGHVKLLHALAAVSQELPELKLLLVGAGEAEYTEALQNLTTSLGIADRVIFVGRSDNVPGLLKMCGGKVLASCKEGFGAVLVEAMACGLPTIATKSGGPEEIVVPGETGWLVEPDGIQPLAEALHEFLADEERRRRFGIAGRERAERLFSRELMIQRYQQLYLEVVGATERC
jgi:glycosyltransferase involved in cell wall biosynthesis